MAFLAKPDLKSTSAFWWTGIGVLLLLPISVQAQFADDPFDPFGRGADPFGAVPVAAPVQVQGQAVDAAADESEDMGDEPAEPEVSTTDVPPAEPLGPNYMRLHLQDGSVISGDLTINEFAVQTEFGVLTIPVNQIRSFRPGLSSLPVKAAEIEQLLADLGDDEYAVRENAHKELVAYGLLIKNLVDNAQVVEGNAEQKRHLEEIRKEFEDLESDFDEWNDDEKTLPWIYPDTIVSSKFTMVGKILEESFAIQSKYGDLQISLADINMGDRPSGSRPEIRRALTVNGQNFAQLAYKSSGIRVARGDKITIKAEGSMVMSPWGSNSSVTPDGASNYGWYIPNDVPVGGLVARIGSKNREFMIGSSKTFEAKSSGTLEFAIGMDNDYVNGGYAFPGQYSLKIKVEPK